MSIEPKGTCPPSIQTVLQICQETFIDARLTNDDALSAACMLLGFVAMNQQDSKAEAMAAFSDCIYDIYQYIDQNFEQVQEMRRIIRSKRNG